MSGQHGPHDLPDGLAECPDPPDIDSRLIVDKEEKLTVIEEDAGPSEASEPSENNLLFYLAMFVQIFF